MKAVTFLLHTQQPILATSLQGDPNSDVSHSYIPGSMIRGLLISRYLREYSPSEPDILDNEQVKQLLFNGTNRYLNAYLFDGENEQRTLPIPLSLYKDKGKELDKKSKTDIWEFSQPDTNIRPNSLQRLERGFCLADYSYITVYQEKRRINIHNQRNRQRGRGNEASGAVFRYDAIDAGQTFQAVVLCASEQDAKTIKSLLEPEKKTEKINAWVGGSQSAGYGHVTIELLPDEDNWNEVKIDWEERIDRQNNLTITLLSDTILRDECGQHTTEPEELVKLVTEALGVRLKHLDTYSSSTIVGGFNKKWGLPLPQAPAFAAGSLFVFELPNFETQSEEEIFSHKVRDLEFEGIGERRVDGFGRIAFNWLREESIFTATKFTDSTANNQEEKPLCAESKQLAQRMAERLLRQKLDDLLLERLEASTPKDSSKISNSQLSRLMIVARRALTEGKPDQLEQLLNSDNLTRTARSQFNSTKIDEMSFDERVRKWLEDYKLEDDQRDNWIRSHWRDTTDENGWPQITIAGQHQNFDNQLSLEYTLRLIMAVTKKMMKDKNND